MSTWMSATLFVMRALESGFPAGHQEECAEQPGAGGPLRAALTLEIKPEDLDPCRLLQSLESRLSPLQGFCRSTGRRQAFNRGQRWRGAAS